MKPRWTPALAIVATVMTAATMSACSPLQSGPDTEALKKLTIAIPNISPPYNASNQANTALRITTNIFDPLIFTDPKTKELRPGIATSWTKVSDTELDLKIRDDVKFQDGTPLTVEDVAFTLSAERLWGPKALEPTTLASTFAAVKVLDNVTVRVTTKQPDPGLLLRLASPIGFVAPKKLIESEGIEAFGRNPVGTGPYKVKSVAPGESVVLEANDKYWGGVPTYEELTFRQVSEVSARVSGLATGEYNVVTNLPPDQTSVVESNGQSTASVQVNNLVALAFVTARRNSPIADERVRQALALAVNRQEINDSLWGSGTPVPDGLNLPIYTDFFNKDQTASPQDTNKAKSLLKDAGYTGAPIVLRYVSGYYTNLDKALEAMLPMWAAAGLNVKLEAVADYTLLDYLTADVYATSTNVLIPDPVSPMWVDWVAPASGYVSRGRGVNGPELTTAVRDLAENVDTKARKSAYDKATELWNEELPALTLWQPVDIYGLGAGVDLIPDARYWMRLAPIPAS